MYLESFIWKDLTLVAKFRDTLPFKKWSLQIAVIWHTVLRKKAESITSVKICRDVRHISNFSGFSEIFFAIFLLQPKYVIYKVYSEWIKIATFLFFRIYGTRRTISSPHSMVMKLEKYAGVIKEALNIDVSSNLVYSLKSLSYSCFNNWVIFF